MTTEKQMVNSLNEMVMTDEAVLSDMISIVGSHFNQIFDKSGKPYSLHCFKVMHYLQPHGMLMMAAGAGHDLFEDKSKDGKQVTRRDLLLRGHPDVVVDTIQCVTKMPGQSYDEYKETVLSNDRGILLKMADIRHNSDLRRMKGVRQKDFDRHLEYMAFYNELEQRAIERGLIRV